MTDRDRIETLKRQLDSDAKSIALIRRLVELGWIPPGKGSDGVSVGELSKTLTEYQEFFGIEPTGTLNRFTERSLTNLRFCGHPDVMPLTEGLSMWPRDGRPVTWSIMSQFPTLTTDEAKQAYSWAMAQWTAVCGLDIRYNPNPKTADVAVYVNQIDGRANVLAQSQLPNNQRSLMRQFYDSAEPYVFAEKPKPHEIDIGRVMCHENGHVIGIGHISNGNLLQPLYDLNIRSPQRGDIREAQDRYGPPLPTAPDPKPDQTFTITLKGVSDIGSVIIPGFEVRKL